MNKTVKTVRVELGDRSYDVRIGAGLLAEAGRLADALGRVRRVAVIADDRVAELYGQAALEALATDGRSVFLMDFPAGEPHKTLATYRDMLDGLLTAEPPIDRDTLIVALGGGVTGDLAGFVAATALRGLRFIQCPTTLLADVDSSVGGKTGVDHAAGKNLIGAFHQPAAVLIDVETLKTLDDRDLKSGLAECVKHGVIRDASLLDFIERNAEAIFAREPEVLIELVARNVAIKAAVVSADEREAGQRAHLNFGHTVGHAVETLAGYGNLTHGEAVALGMVAANAMAVERKLIAPADADRITKLLDTLGLPTQCDELDAAAVLEIMQHDKKARGGNIRMVLPTRLGAVDVYDDVTTDEILQSIGCLVK